MSTRFARWGVGVVWGLSVLVFDPGAAGSAEIELYDHATLQHEDTRSQHGLDRLTRVLGVPFLAIRAALVVPGAAAGELGNGLLILLDRPAPGSVPHAEGGWLWNGALRSLRDDWRESTPGS